MPILYSVISRGTTVLAKNAECVGNFAEVTEQIIKNIPSHNHKLTYAHGNYLIHFISEDRIIYMCITDDEFERARAFMFLTEIKRRFLMQYGLQAATAISYAMNTEFSPILAYEMKHYSESNEFDAISRVHGQIDELKDIMVKNIENVTARGERLELLVNKTENLRDTSVSFRKTSRNLARAMFWNNIKMYVIVGAVILFIIYVIVSMACGGLLWQECVHKR
ncbi:vesicle-associated membrane protein 7 [Sitodiplosis mosellana]|uniref:vesicle-associated membrane protein 7 n=1 Tax=Sitodiplosis mosellana TaxID=263140 RepID=UPI00244388C6|nr:vesicle-associated membrane protein 7 [Sitodiplosis mosellana]XP_055300669.1 vesicle-associated membrane protein 7 [Sitodiplosis mosellana]XP_055300670.1 vesicle-associated membrane protein 7 [Sitodiplosis mosellana]